MCGPGWSDLREDALLANLSTFKLERKLRNARSEEQELSVLQTEKKNNNRAVDYQTFRLTNYSQKRDDMPSTYIPKMVKNMKLQVEAHFFDSKNLISSIGFLTTFKLACNMNNIHEEIGMWVFLF